MARAIPGEAAPGAAERRPAGRALRAEVPRSAHAEWAPPAGRDPLASIEAQEKGRIAELLPLRHERMAASPFAFFRGTSALGAADVAGAPSTGMRVQACGDAHISNFGLYATPERRLVFDLNDFDETLPAPFEWDVKRFAASIAIVARQGGASKKQAAKAAAAGVGSYRLMVAELAEQTHLEVFYARIDAEEIARMVEGKAAKTAREAIVKARRRTQLQAFEKLTKVVRGRRVIADDPPLIEHLDAASLAGSLSSRFHEYAESLDGPPQVLVRRYQIADWARKVVGVGSVGTECDLVLMLGDGQLDPLLLQVKEARHSVLEPFAGTGRIRHLGKRVVMGQRLTQAASDAFLGWTTLEKSDVYVRQLRDMRGSVEVEALPLKAPFNYPRICGAALGRAHSRSGDPAKLAGYLGSSTNFDEAVAEFAVTAAEQNEHDHAQFLEAIASGRFEASGRRRRP